VFLVFLQYRKQQVKGQQTILVKKQETLQSVSTNRKRDTRALRGF